MPNATTVMLARMLPSFCLRTCYFFINFVHILFHCYVFLKLSKIPKSLSLRHCYPNILQAVRKAIIAGSFTNACHLEVFALFN
jgi:hypothetical protein